MDGATPLALAGRRPASIRAVLLDWDGTLVDSRAAVLAAYRAVTRRLLMREYPVGPVDEARVLTTAEARLFGTLVDDPLLAARLAEAYRAEYLARADPVTAFAGARRLLAGLAARGLKVGIVTSKARAPFELDSTALGLRSLIDAVVAGDDALEPKPAAAPLLACLELLGEPAERAVIVGDAPADVLGGRRAGVRTVAVRHGFDPSGALAAGPDHTIDGLDRLLPLIDALDASVPSS
jgi:HAD superfamily hydrolase (TIGR01509 family)